MPAVVVGEVALPQLAHHLDGLLEHLQPDVLARPAVAEDVLVERLAGADAQGEPAVELHGGGRRGLGHDRRVHPHGRAVTAVVTGSEQACERAPITPQTNGLWPCSSFHGWKWSLIHSASKPACSASTRLLDQLLGSYSSLLRK